MTEGTYGIAVQKCAAYPHGRSWSPNWVGVLGNFYTARGLTLPDVYRDLDHTRRVFVSMDMRVAEAMGQELIRTRFQVRL